MSFMAECFISSGGQTGQIDRAARRSNTTLQPHGAQAALDTCPRAPIGTIYVGTLTFRNIPSFYEAGEVLLYVRSLGSIPGS